VLAIEEENDVAKSIVVMEICLGGSLFNFLSLPTNRHGLCDDELIRVLSDVTQGTIYIVIRSNILQNLNFFYSCHSLSGSQNSTISLCSGVKYLRENNVVHRDLKPGNIMRCINEDGTSLYKLTGRLFCHW